MEGHGIITDFCAFVCEYKKYFVILQETIENMKREYDFYKENPTDKIYWVDTIDKVGEFLFSFDKKKVFNLFADYPHALTKEQKEIFDKENPYWKEFFADRQ